MRIRQSLLKPYVPRTGTLVPWKAQQLEAGVWGWWSGLAVRAAVDCGETDQGDMREEIVKKMPVEESQATMEAR